MEKYTVGLISPEYKAHLDSLAHSFDKPKTDKDYHKILSGALGLVDVLIHKPTPHLSRKQVLLERVEADKLVLADEPMALYIDFSLTGFGEEVPNGENRLLSLVFGSDKLKADFKKSVDKHSVETKKGFKIEIGDVLSEFIDSNSDYLYKYL